MSQKNKYRSNSTFKNRSYAKGGEGSVFSNIKHMFSANSSANKQIADMNEIQTELKENLKNIDKSIDTFKRTYAKLTSKVSYIDTKIDNITKINEQCKKMHPSIVTSTENKGSESKGFFSNLFGSTTNAPTTEADDEHETPKDETPKDETPKDETPEYETPQYETPKDETPKDETPQYETPQYETPKDETPQYETPKDETPKDETPQDETPKDETPESFFKNEKSLGDFDLKSDLKTNPFSDVLYDVSNRNTFDNHVTNLFEPNTINIPAKPVTDNTFGLPDKQDNTFGSPQLPANPLHVNPLPVNPLPVIPPPPTNQFGTIDKPKSENLITPSDDLHLNTKGGIRKKNKKSTKKKRKSRR